MLNEVVQQPPTTGKVIMVTTFGELDIELWCKECPKACKNFLQLCMEGYYDGSEFHRLIPNFMIQGGQPKGCTDGEGGQSIYGVPFPDEYHQRLKFQQRGLLAMANSQPNDNRSQFFITLDSCPWLDKKHTIFGRVAGNTIYNLLQVNNIDTDGEDRPVLTQTIISTKVIVNPMDDIVVRNVPKPVSSVVVQPVPKVVATKKRTKNTSLLSFDDEEVPEAIGGMVNSHDVLNDPKLKKEAVLTQEELEEKRRQRQAEQTKLAELKSKLHASDRGEGVEAIITHGVRKHVDISDMLGAEDKNLLKWKRSKNDRGESQIAFDEESSSSSSSSSEYENEEIRKLRQEQKSQYESLKAEVLLFKQNKLGSNNEMRNEHIRHEKKLLSNVEARRLKFVQDKQTQRHENEIMKKLEVFRERLGDAQGDRLNWMNHKLKFHIDSVTAFSVHDTKERVQDFIGQVRSSEQPTQQKKRTNVKELLKLSE